MENTTTYAEYLAQLSDAELVSMLSMRDTWLMLDPSSAELIGKCVQERIRRHALVCQDLECGFSPLY
jgi:hypothetical protein